MGEQLTTNAIPQKHVQTFGDALHYVLVQTIEADHTPGLYTLQFPTGSGKSYAIEHTIASLVAKMPEDSAPIIYITPQKKNIPKRQKISEFCQKEGATLAPHDIMRLYSVEDMLSKTASDELLATIPHEHKEQTNVEELIHTVLLLKKSKEYGDAVRRLLPEFKRSVRALFPCVGWEERLELIESDLNWQWIGKLWPAVYTRRAKVLLMTASKFFWSHDTLVEPACSIDKAEWIGGSIVFMDEFDATKKDCLNAILSSAMHSNVDLASLARSLWHGVNMSTLPQSLLAGGDSDRNAERMQRLKSVLDDTAQKTSIDFVYKAEEGVVGSAGLFLYDGSRRATNVGDPFLVHTDRSRKENVIVKKKRKIDDEWRHLSTDVNEIRGAISYAQHVIASLLQEKHGYGAPGLDETALTNEIMSVLDALQVKDRDAKQLMCDEVKGIIKGGGRNRGTVKEERTLYEQGFGLISVEDSETHSFSTHIYAYAMDDTPEKRLRSLIERALVFGVSATALIDSPLCNYDLDWMAEQRPDLVRTLSDEHLELLRDAYAEHIKGYEEIELRVLPIDGPQSVDGGIYRTLPSILKNPCLRDRAANLLRGVDRGDDVAANDYAMIRYVRAAMAYRYFLENVPEGVFICATTAAPKRGSNNYELETLQELLDMVRQDRKVTDGESSVVFFESSENFEERYAQSIKELGEDCPRMFICASYETLATGVNLQYNSKGMKHVEVGGVPSDGKMDLVGIYLDRITNIAPTRNRIGEKTRNEDLLRCAFELREMAWHGDITIDEMDHAVRGLMSANHYRSPKLVDKPSVMAACARVAAQMVGRMCRTSTKAPVLHILFDGDLATKVDPYAMGEDLLGVETRELLSALELRSDQTPDPQGKLERKIAMRGLLTAAWCDRITRRSTWSREDMRTWEAVRQESLAHPCPAPDELSEALTGGFYVDAGNQAGPYRYCVQEDFKNVGVSFDITNAEDFPREVSMRSARLDVLKHIPEVRGYFEQHGWPLVWEYRGLVMNPAYYQNVYLGALGEQAGKAILESHIRGLVLAPITEPAKYEKFDFVIEGSNVYVDFKYWRAPDTSGERYLAWICEKMRMVGTSYALMVNLMSNDELRDQQCEEINRTDEFGTYHILSVPYLIDDRRSCVSETNVGRICSWLKKAGASR